MVLILDTVGLARSIGLSQSLELGIQHISERFIPPREKTRLVLFRAGGAALKVVPLSLISRIESATGAVGVSDGMLVMQHRGHLMPLQTLDGRVAIDDAADHPVLVLGIGGESVGLVVDEILDIVEDFLDIEIASGSPGVIGSARISNSVVEVIDISHFVKIARPDALARGIVSRFSVLLVDDRLFFRDMLAPLLAAAGFRVTTASSGRDALFLLSRGATFNAIVTDTDMPEMDGYTLAREIKRDPAPRQALPDDRARRQHRSDRRRGGGGEQACAASSASSTAPPCSPCCVSRPRQGRRSGRTVSKSASSGSSPHDRCQSAARSWL